MSNRLTLEKFMKKFNAAEKGNSKELRLPISDVKEFHIALLSVLLENSEKNEENRNLKIELHNVNRQLSSREGMDGGKFKND